MTPPVVSVLLPVRNGRPWLARALESLQRQTWDDFEVLVQDDGSRDGSREVAASFARKDARIRVAGGPARGIATALNQAAARARGRLIVRMDADDVCGRLRLGATVRAFADDPALGFLGTRVRYVPRWRVRDGMRRYEAWLDGALGHAQILADRFVECPLAHPTWALRREVLDALGGYRQDGWPEDYDLFLRAADAGVRFAKLPGRHVFLREHDARTSRTDPRYGRDRFLALKMRHLLPCLYAVRGPIGLLAGRRATARWSRALAAAGFTVRAFPGEPETPAPPATDAFLLVAAGRPDRRARMRANLARTGLVEGADWLCVE